MPGGPPKFGEFTWARKGGSGCCVPLIAGIAAGGALVGSAMHLVATITGGTA